MPPLPPVPNVFKVAVSGVDSGGNVWANVMHYRWFGNTPSAAVLNTIAVDITSAWQANLTPLQSTGTTLEHATVTDLTSPTGAVGEDTVSVPGTRAGTIIPGSAAYLVSYPGAGPRYRGGHPRQYLLLGVNTDLLDESHWTSAASANFLEGFVNFQDAVEGTEESGTSIGTQCAVSYYTTDYATTPHTRIRKAVPDVYDITSRVGNAQLASQRGRIGRKRR